jgi:hypothetical protein
MNPRVRYWLGVSAGCILALWVGSDVAQESYLFPTFISLVAICAFLVRSANVNLDALVLGLTLIGYLVGNRGFAQFMPFPRLPLLPAEMALGLTGGWLIVKCAFARRLPWRNDALNWALLGWMLVGTVRVLFDLRAFGLIAVRDFAMIYYAGFFFVAQALSAEEPSKRFLQSCLAAAAILLPLVFALYQSFPDFFFRALTLHGAPLVYYKDDLLETSLAVCSVTLFHMARDRHRYWAWPLALFVFLHVIASDSRASVIGAFVMLIWLVLTRRPVFPALQAGAMAMAFAAVLLLASIGNNPWAKDRLEGLTDRVASLYDAYGQRAYESAESSDKGDNNRFRMIWWRTVAEETLQQAPVCGLGFGYDLAKGFVQNYDPTMGDEFLARSPHNFVMTIFGRMGGIGLAVFLFFGGALILKTWRTLRDPSTEPAAVGLWCAAWMVLTSACFGVVLEGPMGAVVFWTVLGLANGISSNSAAAPDAGAQTLAGDRPEA